MPLKVELVSAETKVWSGTAAQVIARTVDGDIGVLPGHQPLLALLAPSEVTISPEGGGDKIIAYAEEGFLSVDRDRVTIVAGRASLGAHNSN